MSDSTCRHCHSTLDGVGRCTRCLLETGLDGEGRTGAERLFRIALSYDTTERESFVREAAGADSGLLAEVMLLLEGFAEAGGDGASVTMGSAQDARHLWAAARREEPGTLIDHFRLVKLVGQGGMGSVWEADQLSPMKRRVALKIIKLGMDTEEVVRRFERERRTLALMTHPHIAQVYEAGATPQGRPYFAMELVEGKAITQHCRDGALTVKDRLVLFLEVCSAMEHAHQKGVIHRDLKPSNILIAYGSVKVIDFGIAKATLEEGADGLQTRQAQVLGTPAYMSPEQADSDGLDVDTRTDVYSLGVVLYELLSGQLPFDPVRLATTSLREMQRILREEEPPRPSVRATGLGAPPGAAKVTVTGKPDADLDWIVMKSLSKERSRRYASAAALAEDIRRSMAGKTVSAVPPTWQYRSAKFVRRHRVGVAAVVAVTLSLAGGLLVSLRQVNKANEALKGEARALRQATSTVADLYTRNGLAAGRENDPTRAALWFAKAAVTTPADRERQAANLSRQAAWRQEAALPVRAFATGLVVVDNLKWNRSGTALIASTEQPPRVVVLDAASEGVVKPGGAWPTTAADWTHDGKSLVHASDSMVRITSYPDGVETARVSVTGPVECLTVSPDDRWVAVAGPAPFLWEPATGVVKALAKADSHPMKSYRFSADSKLLLANGGALTTVCEVSEPGRFLIRPMLRPGLTRPDFVGTGETFFTRAPNHDVLVINARTGQVREGYRWTQSSDGSPGVCSPDGKFIAGFDMTAIQRENGTLNYPIHKNRFEATAFTADSRYLLSAGADSTLRMWDTQNKIPPRVIGWHVDTVTAPAPSPDGAYVASAQGRNGLTRIWRLPQAAAPLDIPVRQPSGFRLSPDGGLLAPNGTSINTFILNSTRVYNSSTGVPAGPELMVDGVIVDTAFIPGTTLLAIACANTPNRATESFSSTRGTGHIEIRNYLNGMLEGYPISLSGEPRGMAAHPSGKFLAVFGSARELLEIDVATRAVEVLNEAEVPLGTGDLSSNGNCRYSPDGRFLIGYGMRRVPVFWDREEHRRLNIRAGNMTDAAVMDVDFKERVMAVCSITSDLEFVRLPEGGTAAPSLKSDGNWLFLARFSPDNDFFLSAGRSGQAHIRNWKTGELAAPALQHEGEVFAGTFLPGSRMVATGGLDGFLYFWDSRTGLPMRPPLATGSQFLDLAVSGDGSKLIRGNRQDSRIRLYDLKALLPELGLDPDEALLLAEIEAAAEVANGGLVPLSEEQWLARWRKFRAGHPAWPP